MISLFVLFLAASIDPRAVNTAASSETLSREARGPTVLRAQILLGRAHFSPGEIDGVFGSNTAKAVKAFRAARGLPEGDTIEAGVWAALEQNNKVPAIVPYTITSEDVAGPFMRIPRDLMEQTKLKKLGYESPLEALSEKFHCSRRVLQELNPGKNFTQAGEEIQVPNFLGMTPLPKAASIVVREADRSVTVVDGQQKPIAYYPATVGSEHDPLPVGTWKIQGVSRNPVFHYNPKLFWDADPSHSKGKIAPGPNNPVGVVWIDLSKEHYGIHGAPDPSTIGKTQSHGCIRLTNWDASELAESVAAGIPAILEK
jgi:lipoprotein-anchoring transpeptidase ErfK/SrfK